MFGGNMPGMGGGMPGGGDGFGFELPEGIGEGSIGGAGAGGTGIMPGGVYGGIPGGGLGGAGADGMSAREAEEWAERALATSTHTTWGEDIWNWFFLTEEEKAAKKKKKAEEKKKKEAEAKKRQENAQILREGRENSKAHGALTDEKYGHSQDVARALFDAVYGNWWWQTVVGGNPTREGEDQSADTGD